MLSGRDIYLNAAHRNKATYAVSMRRLKILVKDRGFGELVILKPATALSKEEGLGDLRPGLVFSRHTYADDMSSHQAAVNFPSNARIRDLNPRA